MKPIDVRKPLNVTTAHYPESDGKPMGETDYHRDAMVRIIERTIGQEIPRISVPGFDFGTVAA